MFLLQLMFFNSADPPLTRSNTSASEGFPLSRNRAFTSVGKFKHAIIQSRPLFNSGTMPRIFNRYRHASPLAQNRHPGVCGSRRIYRCRLEIHLNRILVSSFENSIYPVVTIFTQKDMPLQHLVEQLSDPYNFSSAESWPIIFRKLSKSSSSVRIYTCA